MADFKVSYNPVTRIVIVSSIQEPIPGSYNDIGRYTHEGQVDKLGDFDGHKLFHHVRDLLYFVGQRSMQAVKIYLTVPEENTALPVVSFKSAEMITEGNVGIATITYVVERSTSIGSVLVPYSFEPGNTSPDDFIGGIYPKNGSVLMEAGSLTGEFSIKIVGDIDVESNEVFTVRITPPEDYIAGMYMSVTGTILNDDEYKAPPAVPVISLSQGYVENEGDTFNIELKLDRKEATGSFAYSWNVVGTGVNPATTADFGGTMPSGNGTFTGVQILKTISFGTTENQTVQPTRTFRVNVTAPGLNSTFANGSIIDDDVAVPPPVDPEDPEEPPVFVPAPVSDIAYNMSMMEFRPTGGSVNTLVPSDEAMQHFVDRHMMIMRLPIRWSYWQPDLAGPLEMATYGSKVMDVLDRAGKLGIKVLLDEHEYGYAGLANGVKVTGNIRAGINPLVPKEAFANFWGLVATLLKDHPAIWAYDLINEPEGYGDPYYAYNADGTRSDPWYRPSSDPALLEIVPTLFDAATTAIRAIDSKTIIVRGGNHYSGAWDCDVVRPNGFTHNDPVNRTLFAAHCYPDRDSSGTLDDSINGSTYAAEISVEGQAPPMLTVNPHIFGQRIQVFYDQLILHGARPVDGIFGIVGEIGLPTEDDWKDVVMNGLDYCRDKGLLPVVWTAGKTYESGGYPFSIEPKTNGLQSRQMSLISPRLGVPEPTVVEVTGPARAVQGQQTGFYTVTYRGNNPTARPVTVTDTAGWTWPTNVMLPAGRNPSVTLRGTATNNKINRVTITVQGMTNLFDFRVPNVDAQPVPDSQALLTSAAYDPYIGVAVMPSVHSIYSLDVTTYPGPLVSLKNSAGDVKDWYPTLQQGNYFVLDQNAIATWAKGTAANIQLIKIYDQSGAAKHVNYVRSSKYNLAYRNNYPAVYHDGGQQVEFGAITNNIPGQTLMKFSKHVSGSYILSTTSNTNGTIGVMRTTYSVHTGLVYDRNTNAGVTTVNASMDTDDWHLYSYRARTDTVNGLQAFRDGNLVDQTDLAGGNLTWDRSVFYQNVRPNFGNGSSLEYVQRTMYVSIPLTDAQQAAVWAWWTDLANIVGPVLTVPSVILPDRPVSTITMPPINDGRTMDGGAWFGPSKGSGIDSSGWVSYPEISAMYNWGAEAIRIPIKLLYCFLADGTLNLWVLNRVSQMIKEAIANKKFICLDDHSYKNFSDLAVGAQWSIFANALENGTGIANPSYPHTQFGYGGPSQYVGMELQNEPGSGIKDAVNWVTNLRNTIWTVRNGGYKGYLFAGWGDYNNMTYGTVALEQVRLIGGVTEMDPFDRLVFTGHDYWNVGRNDQSQSVLSNIVFSTRYGPTLNKAREIGAKMIISEVGGGITPTGPLKPNVTGGKDGAQIQEDFFAFARANRDVLLGTWFWCGGRNGTTYRHKIGTESPVHLESLQSFWNAP